MVLYTKYRSKTFSEIVGQDAVIKTLYNAVSSGNIGHAYLFSGPRGTGKTSVARILARAINCEKGEGDPCNECPACLSILEGSAVDVIEIDAASHNKVDDIRALIENVNFSPVNLKKKVYIVDEVHMLSRSAFNALLKTLEEPPSHVVFIFATTEINKIPLTILSRCQRFDFKLGSDEEVFRVLHNIIKKENVFIEDSALQYVVDLAGGSYRDAISVLERLLSKLGGEESVTFTRDIVRSILGIPDDVQFKILLNSIKDKDVTGAINVIEEVISSGGDITVFSSYFLSFLRKELLFSLRESPSDVSLLFRAVKEFSVANTQLSSSPVVQLPMEMAVISLCSDITSLKEVSTKNVSKGSGGKSTLFVTNKKNNLETKGGDSEVVLKKEDFDENKSVVETEPDHQDFQSSDLGEDITSSWQSLVSGVKSVNVLLYSFLVKSIFLSFDGNGGVLLQVAHSFHKEQIEAPKSQDLFATIGQNVFGKKIRVRCEVRKKSDDGDVCKVKKEEKFMAVFEEDVV